MFHRQAVSMPNFHQKVSSLVSTQKPATAPAWATTAAYSNTREGYHRLCFWLGLLFISFFISFCCSASLIKFFQLPTRGTEIYQTLPGEFAFTSLSFATWWSQLTFGPLGCAQIFIYFTPGMKASERNILLPGLCCVFLLFIFSNLGLYQQLIPSVFKFFFGWGGKTVSATWTLRTYSQLIFLLSSFAGYLSLIPLLQLLAVVFWGVRATHLFVIWRGVILGLTVLAAIITPSTDPWIQLVISFYLLSIYFGGASAAILLPSTNSKF